jgi:RNA polymerase sigma factor (sigma-70 family)
MTPAEFESEYVRLLPEWVRFAEHLCRDDRGEDIVSEVVVNVCAKMDTLTNDNLHSYVLQAILFHVRKHIWASESSGRNRPALKAVNYPEPLDERVTYKPEYAEEETTTPLERGIREALKVLDNRESDLVCLRVFAQLKDREIAEILQYSSSDAVKHHWQRIQVKLQAALGNVGISSQSCVDSTTPETGRIAS